MRTIHRSALLLVLLAATASAESRAGSARRHFEHGQQLFAAGQYGDASAEFRSAFELERRPKYLYNAAQALRLAGDCRGSVALYEAFLEIAPDADSRAAAARNLERCTAPAPAAEAAAPAAAVEPPAPVAAAPTPGAAAPTPVAAAPTPVVAAPTPAPAATVTAVPPPESPPSDPSSSPPAAVASGAAVVTTTTAVVPSPPRARAKWIGAVGGVTGGAALVTAAMLEGLGASQFDHLTRTCAPRCRAADVLPLQRQLDAATGLFVVGGVLAAATLVTLVVLRVHTHAAR